MRRTNTYKVFMESGGSNFMEKMQEKDPKKFETNLQNLIKFHDTYVKKGRKKNG